MMKFIQMENPNITGQQRIEDIQLLPKHWEINNFTSSNTSALLDYIELHQERVNNIINNSLDKILIWTPSGTSGKK